MRRLGSAPRAVKTVLPYGDSITLGQGSTDGAGYRSRLFALAAADGKTLRFVGSKSDGPTTVNGMGWSRSHEGWSGLGISGNDVFVGYGIQNFLPSPALDARPDIVLLHIGVNDVNWVEGYPTYLDRLAELVRRIFLYAPGATVVMAQNTTGAFGAPPAWTTYVNGIPGVAASFAARGYSCPCVNFQALDAGTDLADPVHPNDSGYQKMAAIWYPAIKGLL